MMQQSYGNQNNHISNNKQNWFDGIPDTVYIEADLAKNIPPKKIYLSKEEFEK